VIVEKGQRGTINLFMISIENLTIFSLTNLPNLPVVLKDKYRMANVYFFWQIGINMGTISWMYN